MTVRTAAAHTAVVTIVSGRREHLDRQRDALAGADLHVVVSMGEDPPAEARRAPTTVWHRIDATASGLPLSAARNAGAALALDAGAEVLVFLDVDCIPGPELVGRYSTAARQVAGPALLCGPVTYLPPPPPGGYPSDHLGRLGAPHPARPAPPTGAVVRDDRFELFWSLSFAVTRATWDLLGGFDEGFVGYGAEDTDFAVRAAGAGAGLWWVGGADAYHQHHPPSRRDPERVGELVANARRFARRHGWWPMAGWLTELAADGTVEFDPAAGRLDLAAGPTRRRGPTTPRMAPATVPV